MRHGGLRHGGLLYDRYFRLDMVEALAQNNGVFPLFHSKILSGLFQNRASPPFPVRVS